MLKAWMTFRNKAITCCATYVREKEKLEFFPKASYFTPIGDSASPVTTLQHAYIFICRYFLIWTVIGKHLRLYRCKNKSMQATEQSMYHLLGVSSLRGAAFMSWENAHQPGVRNIIPLIYYWWGCSPRLQMWRQKKMLARGEATLVLLHRSRLSLSQKPRSSPAQKRKFHPGDAFEDTSLKPWFELSKSKPGL